MQPDFLVWIDQRRRGEHQELSQRTVADALMRHHQDHTINDPEEQLLEEAGQVGCAQAIKTTALEWLLYKHDSLKVSPALPGTPPE